MKISNTNKIRIKALLVLMVVFLTVKTAAPNVFMANTPKFKPEFIASIKDLPNTLKETTGKAIALLPNIFKKQSSAEVALNSIPKVTPPPSTVFSVVAKGVRAGEDKTTGEKYIQLESGVKYRVTTEIINGKEYQVLEIIE